MKTITITSIVILISLIMGCSNDEPNTQDQGNTITQEVYDNGEGTCQVHLIHIKGHEYIITHTSYGYGGTCIIHAAHCPCQQNTNK